MKNQPKFSPEKIEALRQTVLTSGVTGGPGNEDLKNAFFTKYSKKEIIFFWLDETVKLYVSLSSIAIDPRDNGGKTQLILKGKLRYADVPFHFTLYYDSFNRQGNRGDYRECFSEISPVTS